MLEGPPSGIRWWANAIIRTIVFTRFRAVLYYRISQILAQAGLLPLAYLVQSRCVARTGAEINPLAQIGPGLNLLHSVGVVIGSEVHVGARAWIHHGVTLGSGSVPGQPHIGDDVFIGAGAKLLGGITIGDGAVIGANAVVVCDIPAGVVARGVPARVESRSMIRPRQSIDQPASSTE